MSALTLSDVPAVWQHLTLEASSSPTTTPSRKDLISQALKNQLRFLG